MTDSNKIIRLGVNVDHVATLRNARGENYPSVIQAAGLAELGGADNITCHLREDRRHIRDRDVELLRETINIPLNFEMAATEEMLAIAKRVRPAAVTLVPEKREELTTEGGLNLRHNQEFIRDMTQELKDLGTLVCYFVYPDAESVELTRELGGEAVEFHTGDFCHRFGKVERELERQKLLDVFVGAAEQAHQAGLQVHVGHGLNYANTHMMRGIPYLEEANIGHAIISRALFVGLSQAVSDMKKLLNP